MEHRDPDNSLLTPQEMVSLPCQCKFRVYEPWPEFRPVCPYVLLICSGAHTHPIPLPTRTPPHIRQQIFTVFEKIGYEIADITPRRFLRHPIVRNTLQQLLPHLPNPALCDLHISLANRDHIKSYIRSAKNEMFPLGTGWEGMSLKAWIQISFQYYNYYCSLGLKRSKHLQNLPVFGSNSEPYIRYMAEVSMSDIYQYTQFSDSELATDPTPCQIVICMSPTQSRRLLKAQYLQSDIAFKRVTGFKEFELGGLDRESKNCKCLTHHNINIVLLEFCRHCILPDSSNTGNCSNTLFYFQKD